MECLVGLWDPCGEIEAMIMPEIGDTRIRETIETMDMITDAATVMTIMAATR